MLQLKCFSPWNGHQSFDGADSDGGDYTLGSYDFDRSSYGPIADAMEVACIVSDMIVGGSVPVFGLKYKDQTIEIDSLDEAFGKLGL